MKKYGEQKSHSENVVNEIHDPLGGQKRIV